jgi:hypothetical protein
MKKFLITVSAVVIIALTAFQNAAPKEHLAKVQKMDGLSVYIMSEPADPYYKLGQVGSGTLSQFNAMIKTVVKNVKTQYPDADGVIFDAETKIGYGVKFK